jgi:peptidoglycan hydrolase-like protein with peptidoglycan-binding domain
MGSECISEGRQVSVIQEQLYELDYFIHVVTGYYDPVTAQAMESFQRAKHLNVTGEIDTATLNALEQC